MARHKDVGWDLPDGKPNTTGGNTHCWESIHAALLMDICDELKRMNDILHCHNTVKIPHTLTRIDKRLAKHIPLKGK